MPKCKNDNTRFYKGTEPSPKGLGYCAHTMKEGFKKKGKDGNMWIVKKIKNGNLRWMKVSGNNNYKIVSVTKNNFKKYKLDSEIEDNIKFEINIILKNKNRKGVFLVKNNVIIGFYHLLLEPILLLVYITISKKYRGKKLCYTLVEYLTKYILRNNINILKIVNAGGIPALKCYNHCVNKLKYNIFYKNKKNKWQKINKKRMMAIGKKMIDNDEWMEILFINPTHNITQFKSIIN